MTIGELIKILQKYNPDLKVVMRAPSDYEDYWELYSIKPVSYGSFRGGGEVREVDAEHEANAILVG